jgi:hypothetical protein
MKFPSKKDYKEINDFLDAVEEWCLDFHRRARIEPLKEYYGEDLVQEDKMLELSVAIDREPQYHLICLIRQYRQSPSEQLAFEFIDYIDEAKESIVRLEQHEIAEKKTGKDYRLMYLIAQNEHLYGKSNKEIADKIIEEGLYQYIDRDSLLKNIRKWKKDFSLPI